MDIGVFSGCVNLTDFKLISPLYDLEASRFSSCKGIKFIDILSVDRINDLAFFSCYHLEKIILSPELAKVGKYAFGFCIGLKEVFCPSKERWNDLITNAGDYPNLNDLPWYLEKEDIFVYVIQKKYNEPLLNAKRYYYSEEELPLNADGTDYDDNYWHFDADGKTPVVW